jgi:hypothetical protein
MSEEDTARKKVEIWCKRLRVFEDRCLRRAADLSDQVSEARKRLNAAKSDVTTISDFKELKAALDSLCSDWDDADDDGDWAERMRSGLRIFHDPENVIPADKIISYIETLTPEIWRMLGPELSEMDGEELEVADRNRL